MFEKSRVRKGNAEPLYETLARLSGEYPRWNFHKYLLDRDGELVGSYGSAVKPQSKQLVEAIEHTTDYRVMLEEALKTEKESKEAYQGILPLLKEDEELYDAIEQILFAEERSVEELLQVM